MPHELHVRRPDGCITRVPLDESAYTLGRSESSDLSFPDDTSLSRRHLRLDLREEHWWLTDLGSKNGTLLNGAKIRGRHRIETGDRVHAGQLTLVYVDADGTTGDVTFEAGAQSSRGTTFLTSLEGVLYGERTDTSSSREIFRDPVVQALIRAGRELAGARPLAELFELILELSIETVRAERGVLMTREQEGLVTRAMHGEGFQLSTAIRDRVMREKRSVLVRDVEHEEALAGQLSITGQRIHSLMAVPLQTEADVIGLVYVDSRSGTPRFTEDDLNLLTVLANVAAIRIDRERHMQLQRLELRRTRELEQAAEIQRSILPTGMPTFRGFDLAGYNSPCQTVGGDYYDFIELPSGRLRVVVGDVAGKGMSAALLMSSLQARVQLLSEEPLDSAELTERLDRSLARSCPPNRFVTFFASELSPADRQLNYCNAGHNPGLLLRRDGSIERLEPTGPPLGVAPGTARRGRTLALGSGDLLAIYSDGVTESEREHSKEEFGESRLAQLLASSVEVRASEVVSRVTGALRQWNPGPAEDDMTLVVARCS